MDTEVKAPLLDITSDLARYARRSRVSWQYVAWLVLVAALIAAGALYQRASAPTTRYVTADVTKGSLTLSVTAAGNLQPRNEVEIGSEISGTVRAVHVDVNDSVIAGQVLATLDTSRLQAQLSQAQSAVASARARVLQSQASLEEASTSYERLLKLRDLSGNKLPSQQDLDLADAALVRARGEVAAMRAAVAQAQANEEAIETDLSKAEIRSPINGVVLVRSIEPGQTVAASLQAPVLFVLAEDLRELELHVALDEADVGAVDVGQTASFTVDAFPDRTFEARITQIHLASSNTRQASAEIGQPSASPTTTNTVVVTYPTLLEVENPDLLLRPGMTAAAEIVTRSVNGATLIPNAAMRFTPLNASFPGMDDDSERGTGMMALMPYLAERWKCPRESGQALGCVWLLEDGLPVLAIFRPGATDRTQTQVLDLHELPNWSTLSRFRNDPILTAAVARELVPGMQVIVDSLESAQ